MYSTCMRWTCNFAQLIQVINPGLWQFHWQTIGNRYERHTSWGMTLQTDTLYRCRCSTLKKRTTIDHRSWMLKIGHILQPFINNSDNSIRAKISHERQKHHTNMKAKSGTFYFGVIFKWWTALKLLNGIWYGRLCHFYVYFNRKTCWEPARAAPGFHISRI